MEYPYQKVLRLRKKGLKKYEIANKLGISLCAVYHHLYKLRKKGLLHDKKKVKDIGKFGERKVIKKKCKICKKTFQVFFCRKNSRFCSKKCDREWRRRLKLSLRKLTNNCKLPSAKWKLAYLAGLLDGEGSILISNTFKGTRQIPIVRVNNTDKKMIDWIKKEFGGHINSKDRTRKPHWKILYRWETNAIKDTYLILNAVFPYLITKKQNAKKVIAWSAKKIEKYNSFEKELNKRRTS